MLQEALDAAENDEEDPFLLPGEQEFDPRVVMAEQEAMLMDRRMDRMAEYGFPGREEREDMYEQGLISELDYYLLLDMP
jgi:hypothetical protein